MLNQLLPRHVDNTYHGHKLALWLFGTLVLMRTLMSVNSIFNAEAVATSADGIPLDAYTPAGARTVLTQFALLGLSNLVICLVCVVVLARYRALAPFMFALLLLHHLGRKLILQAMPIVRAGDPPASVINLILLTLTVVGLALSLWPHHSRQ